MKLNRSVLGFAAVPFLWALLAAVFGRQLVAGKDYILLVAMSAVLGLVWLGFVHMCAGVVRKGQPMTGTVFVGTAVIGTGASAMVGNFMQYRDVAGALELGGGITILALVSSVVFVILAGMPWKRA